MTARIKQLLKTLHERPGFVWGDSIYPFTSLVAFVAGYETGRDDVGLSARELVPDGFYRFVAMKYRHEYPNPLGWIGLIRNSTSSEREAFEAFFQLREEYERDGTKPDET